MAEAAFHFNDFDDSVDLPSDAQKNLQTHILRSTERARSTQVFRRFASDKALAEWLVDAQEPTASTSKASVLRAVLFTKRALKRLGVTAEKLGQMNAAFRRGSRAEKTLSILNDKGVETWNAEHRAPWDVVELYAHGPKDSINPRKDGDFVVEYGSAIDKHGKEVTKNSDKSYGHFKVRDGISMLIYDSAGYANLGGKPKKGEPWAWDPREKLTRLLVRDVLADSRNAYGSYFVFRKYRQDPEAFEQRVKDIAKDIEDRRRGASPGLPPEEAGLDVFKGKHGAELIELVRTWIFGRDPKGDTLVSSQLNNFNFEQDVGGKHCPFHAHMRKMNSRGMTGNPEREKQRLVARRGTSCIATETSAGRTDNKGVLFWCAQAQIDEQFEFLMQVDANYNGANVNLTPTPDLDDVIGSLGGNLAVRLAAGGVSRWRQWKTTTGVDFTIWNTVQPIALEYFYAVSIPGFKNLQTKARSKLTK